MDHVPRGLPRTASGLVNRRYDNYGSEPMKLISGSTPTGLNTPEVY